ncbi:hypothetical protein LWI29_011638 [Acer saccharum]|uniref:Uncharacterized protein n=1 Tax=Acer saccharum TaxID=4024 RepID=A0AA39S8C2_ACESA|nr:hypothetical protein LWI29_011638 [Acer saccharum]KAK1564819.1 hypothetical protein Q3G72_012270 [Acer saccharum]
MEVTRASFGFVAVVLLFVILSPAVHAQTMSTAPYPTTDGTSIDQGIAYVLMLVALVLTYLIHAADLACPF